jgi:hypothetical protein
MSNELPKVKELYKCLLRQKERTFPKPRVSLDASLKQGVYVISSRKGVVLHVGKTVRAKNGLKQRLTNHLHGQSSFTIKYMNGEGFRLRGVYKYKYLEVKHHRLRALLEAYAISNLCPKHLG